MSNNKSVINLLQELLIKKGAPTYNFTIKRINDCTLFVCKVSYKTFNASGEGSSKKEAKHNAAENMLSLLKINNEISVPTDMSSVANITQSSGIDGESSLPQSSTFVCNYVGTLQELCQQQQINLKEILYKDLHVEGQDHQKIFTIEVILGSLKERGTGISKKAAKQEAARKLLVHLNSKANSNMNNQNIAKLDTTKSNIDNINLNNLNKEMLKIAIRDLGTEILECSTDKETPSVLELSEKAKSLYLEHVTKTYKRGIGLEIDPSVITNFHILFKEKYSSKIPCNTRKKMQIIQNKYIDWMDQVYEIRKDIERLLNVKIKFSVYRAGKNHIVFVHLLSNPQVSQVGVGNTKTIAESNAIYNLVAALLIFLN